MCKKRNPDVGAWERFQNDCTVSINLRKSVNWPSVTMASKWQLACILGKKYVVFVTWYGNQFNHRKLNIIHMKFSSLLSAGILH